MASPAEAGDVEPVGPLVWLGAGIAHVVEAATRWPTCVTICDVDYGARPDLQVRLSPDGTRLCVVLTDRHVTVIGLLDLEGTGL